MKNIWETQEPKLIPLASSHSILSMVGNVDMDKPRSATASIARSTYIGVWRLRSALMMEMTVKFPSSARRYVEQRGTADHIWVVSHSGKPPRKSDRVPGLAAVGPSWDKTRMLHLIPE